MLGGDGQHDGDGGAQAFFGVDAPGAAGGGDQPVHHGQAEACALAEGLGGEERLEDPVDDGLGHAGVADA
nr:hypothetical protein [Actinoplanes sichuanensis]